MAKKHGASDDTRLAVTVAALIVAFPIGLFLMWTWTKWPTWVKWLVTAPYIAAILIGGTLGFFSAASNSAKYKTTPTGEGAYCLNQCGGDPDNVSCIRECTMELINNINAK